MVELTQAGAGDGVWQVLELRACHCQGAGLGFAEGVPSGRAFRGDYRDGGTGQWGGQRGDKHSAFSCRLYGCGDERRPEEGDGEGGAAVFQLDDDS